MKVIDGDFFSGITTGGVKEVLNVSLSREVDRGDAWGVTLSNSPLVTLLKELEGSQFSKEVVEGKGRQTFVGCKRGDLIVAGGCLQGRPMTNRSKEEERKLREDKSLRGVVEVTRREEAATNEVTLRAGKDGLHKTYAKVWRVKMIKTRVTLGRDVGMQEISMLSTRGLVGRFGYRALGALEIHNWVEVTWYPVLGYLHDVFILTRGWLCFVFKTLNDMGLILQ